MIGRRISRRVFALSTIATTALAGTAHAASLTADEVTIGAASAPLHLIEYASSTCPHCAAFHDTAWETLKTQYIDSGRVRFTFREMATAPQAIALAMFQLARCETTAPDEYLRRVGVMFERRAAIFSTPTGAAIQAALLTLGGEWGLTQTQVMAAINDPAGPPRIIRSMEQAAALGITSTPSFLLNGEKIEDHDFHTLDGMRRILDAG